VTESSLRLEKRLGRARYWAALTPAQRLRRAARLINAARALRKAGLASLINDRAELPRRSRG
jgi:hypothetical protein